MRTVLNKTFSSTIRSARSAVCVRERTPRVRALGKEAFAAMQAQRRHREADDDVNARRMGGDSEDEGGEEEEVPVDYGLFSIQRSRADPRDLAIAEFLRESLTAEALRPLATNLMPLRRIEHYVIHASREDTVRTGERFTEPVRRFYGVQAGCVSVWGLYNRLLLKRKYLDFPKRTGPALPRGHPDYQKCACPAWYLWEGERRATSLAQLQMFFFLWALDLFPKMLETEPAIKRQLAAITADRSRRKRLAGPDRKRQRVQHPLSSHAMSGVADAFVLNGVAAAASSDEEEEDDDDCESDQGGGTVEDSRHDSDGCCEEE